MIPNTYRTDNSFTPSRKCQPTLPTSFSKFPLPAACSVCATDVGHVSSMRRRRRQGSQPASRNERPTTISKPQVFHNHQQHPPVAPLSLRHPGRAFLIAGCYYITIRAFLRLALEGGLAGPPEAAAPLRRIERRFSLSSRVFPIAVVSPLPRGQWTAPWLDRRRATPGFPLATSLSGRLQYLAPRLCGEQPGRERQDGV